MKINFSAIYPEVDTSFSLHHALMKQLVRKLNDLNMTIDFFNKKFDGNDFTLAIIISATRKKNDLEIKGPALLKKDKSAEFAFYIPYIEIVNYSDQVIYVLSNVESGLLYILEKYNTDSSAIREVFNQVSTEFKSNINKYTY